MLWGVNSISDDFEFVDLDATPIDIVLTSDSNIIGRPQIAIANDDQSQKKDDDDTEWAIRVTRIDIHQ